ncbi:MAG TPA: hypothetical protein VFN53_09870 [Acidobacteriaceae bacterium]|nr:hypothetical protein [Acidobacteriaceae bacterium]
MSNRGILQRNTCGEEISIRQISAVILLLCATVVAAGASISGRNAAALSSQKSVPAGKKALPKAAEADPDETSISMRHVIYHVLPNVALSIESLDGVMVQARPGQIISLDDPASFALQIHSAQSSISSAHLSALVNSYILPRAGTPVRDLSMTLNPDQTVSVTGTFHKLVDLHFTSRATLQVTPGGNMRMHFFDMRVGRILHESILDFLGMNVAKVAQPRNPRAFRVEGNDMIFPISQMFPPPRIDGKLQSLSIAQGRLRLIFGGSPAAPSAPPQQARSYVMFHGGSMRFGRLTMTPVEMELVNLKPASHFDFSMARYSEQLVAGYSKSLPNGGLVVHMAGYKDVPPKRQKH